MCPPSVKGLNGALALVLLVFADASAQLRIMRPEDLFRVERVGAISWSPDGRRASIEIHRPGRWLDQSIPTAHIHLLDLTSGTLNSCPGGERSGAFQITLSAESRLI